MDEITANSVPLIIIPARMASTRLPGKPLADIGGVPMIVHVLERAKQANIGPVIIACAEAEVYEAVIAAGGRAVMTDPDLPSGTDRVRIAANIYDADKKHDIIVNVQGDMPTMQSDIIAKCVDVLQGNNQVDIATLVVETDNEQHKNDPNLVKAVMSFAEGRNIGRALYFTRANAPSGDGPVFHHIGIYAYRRNALEKFCNLPPSTLEKRERLEQLRALEAGMRIDARIIDSEPHGVDTPEDLQYARELILGNSNG